MSGETDYLCVGICLPDEDEAYCIGCGRPWGTASVPSAVFPAERDAVLPAPTIMAPHARNPGSLPPTGGRASAWDGPAPTIPDDDQPAPA
jgi:predicted Fe-S protein YdhL (DUF1289 family)